MPSNVQVDPQTKPESESQQIVIVFQEVTVRTKPIHFFVPVKPTTTIGEAKEEFSEMFTHQYPQILPNALVWREISSPFSDQVDPLPISQERNTMVISNVLATLHPANPSPYPSLLAMTFTSAGFHAPPYSHQAEIPSFKDVKCDEGLKAVLKRIARNVFVAIDSSIGPLSQSEYLNYDERPDEIMPLDKSKFLMKTVSSETFVENLEKDLKDILFRPSWFSIIDHVLFHAQLFTLYCDYRESRPMVHIVTGSSGVGKSALRFPCITMAMSLGAERVYTAKGNEYPLQFVLRGKREGIPQNQPPTIVVHPVNKHPRSIEIEPVLYVYDVLLFPTKVKAPSDGDVEYEEDVIFKGTPIRLGEVTVPSIHHFPHFLRLFVGQVGHVQNPLEGKTWHFIDECSRPGTIIFELLSTVCPAVIAQSDSLPFPFMMYTMPKYTLPEAVDVLNSIPCKFQNADISTRAADVGKVKETIDALGFTPRCIQDLSQQEKTLEDVKERRKNIDVTGNLFMQCVSTSLILLDSPQADPINLTTAYTSPETPATMVDLCTRQMQAFYHCFQDAEVCERFTYRELANPELPTIFKRLVNQSIRVGAKFSRLKRGGRVSTTSTKTQMSFPPTPTRSTVETSGQSTMHHAFLPDMAQFQSTRRNKFDDDKWGRYFKTPMNVFTFTRGPAEWRDGMFEFVRVGRESQTEQRGTDPNGPQTRSTRRSDPNLDLRYYTFHLVPHGLFNADFDSMLLFFRVNSNTNEIHSLSVHFLLDSVEEKHVVSEEGANLMKAWLVLLMDVYELDAHQVFPHLMFVVSERVFSKFSAASTDLLGFIPNENIVVVALTTPTAKTIADVRIEVEDTLMIDTGKRLTPNTDPLCVRCGFCGKVLGEHFCYHKCPDGIAGQSALDMHSELIHKRMRRHSIFVWDSEKREAEQRLMNRIADTSPAFVYTRKTLSERDDERDEPESVTQLIGLGIQFASPTKTIPNVEVLNCHASLIVLNVTMVQPALVGHGTRMRRGQEPTLRERLLTDSFDITQRERPLSTTITITHRLRIPHPCQLYRTPLFPPLNPPRPMSSQAERIADVVDRWVEGMWIELPKGWRRSRGPDSTHSPYTALKYEEPSRLLLGSDVFLGQMMLPFEHAGELRERIGRALPTVHPSLVTESGIGRSREECGISECLLGVWRELELLWQVGSLPNMSDDDFWSCFGLTLESSEGIVEAMKKLVTHCGIVMPRFNNLCHFLMAKARVVLERVERCGEAEATSFGSLSSTTAHINDLNEILVDDDMKDWKAALPITDIDDDEIIKRQRELRDLDEEVWGIEHEFAQALGDEPDKETISLMEPPAELVINRWRFVRNKERILQQAWALYHFFGPLTMTLSVRPLLRHDIDSVYQPRLRVRGSAAREDDILRAMRHVCSIIGFVEFVAFDFSVDLTRNLDAQIEKGWKCHQLLMSLWEYLPEPFNRMRDLIKTHQENLESAKLYPVTDSESTMELSATDDDHYQDVTREQR
ncbi:hypothetical protein BLNAU_15338 [Blattamonas nauphoetae]|uniref:C2H2-type domain-containing protein n=1 Tax=Blattamonas nauphoetae TaxID=2049346 RepID=A0ABQ9XFY8_9EUKA|nr:hypothetical protein BLNAU_15338 [Blattamonas nauphoetae]